MNRHDHTDTSHDTTPQRKRIGTIILDFDGTIADTRAIIVRTLHQTIAATGHRQPSDEQCAATIGLPLDEALARLTGTTIQEGRCYAETYRRLFDENNRPEAVSLFPHVAETIRRLHDSGRTITIASSRGHRSLADFAERFALAPYISIILGADDVAKAKPDPEPVLSTLRMLGAAPDTAIVVGDTAYDIVMGQRAGTRTCAVTYGNASRQQLEECGAGHIIDDFALLADIVDNG